MTVTFMKKENSVFQCTLWLTITNENNDEVKKKRIANNKFNTFKRQTKRQMTNEK